MKKSAVVGITSAALLVALLISVSAPSAFAQGRGMGMMNMRPGIVGTISSVSGNTVIVLGHQGFGPKATATTTYTVDASKATVKKTSTTGIATSTISSLVSGDNVFVVGTVTGTNVVATMILDGIPSMRGPGMGKGAPGKGPWGMGSSSPMISGNGEPVVAGSVTALSGSTLTVTTKSNTTYTIDTASAKFVGKNVSTIANIKTGDQVVVQGTVNGSSVTASTVIDGQTMNGNEKGPGGPAHGGGFFGAISSFFSHMFGF